MSPWRLCGSVKLSLAMISTEYSYTIAKTFGLDAATHPGMSIISGAVANFSEWSQQ